MYFLFNIIFLQKQPTRTDLKNILPKFEKWF